MCPEFPGGVTRADGSSVGGSPTPPTPLKHTVSCASGQEYRSEKSLEELTKLVPPECNW